MWAPLREDQREKVEVGQAAVGWAWEAQGKGGL